MGIVGIHPGCFRKSGKQRTYRIRNLEEDTENQMLECLKVCRLECLRERGAGKRRSDGIGGDRVDQSRPMLAYIIVLVKYYYSTSIYELASFVRMNLQREENKGVELTVHRGNRLREGSSESKRKKRQLPHSCTTRKNGAPVERNQRPNRKGCPTRQAQIQVFIDKAEPAAEPGCSAITHQDSDGSRNSATVMSENFGKRAGRWWS
jgi:hypothetical protein